ncbi:hypothetical protein AALP_AA7G226700 [Arabis alpina]|nr:hypothetical protein AALP_AA7G226700 [Arabis alpina]
MEYRKIKDEDDHDVVDTDLESLKGKSHTVASSNIAMATLGVGSSERINWKRK